MIVEITRKIYLDQSTEFLAMFGLDDGEYPPLVEAIVQGNVEYDEDYDGYTVDKIKIIIDGKEVYDKMELDNYEIEDLEYDLVNEYIQNHKE